jgi:hypothetical protein
MTSTADSLVNTMVSAAEGAFGGSWSDIESYTTPELEKIASTIVSIEANVAAGRYTQDTANLILRMQVRSTEAIIVATTGLLLLQVENALNEILRAVADVVNKAVGFPLIALT